MLSALQQQPQTLVAPEIKDSTLAPAEDNTAVYTVQMIIIKLCRQVFWPSNKIVDGFKNINISFQKSADLLHSQTRRLCRFYKRSVKMKSVDHRRFLTYRGRRKYSERNLSQYTFSTINPTRVS